MPLFSLHVDSDEEEEVKCDHPLTYELYHKLQDERDNLSQLYGELKDERDSLEKKVEFLRGEASRWESDYVHAKNATKRENRARIKAETQVYTLNAELKHEEERTNTLKRQFSDLENELDMEQTKVKALKRELNKSYNEVSELTAKFDHSVQAQDELLNELHEQKAQVKALKRELKRERDDAPTTGRTGRTFWDGYVERRVTRSAKRANGTA